MQSNWRPDELLTRMAFVLASKSLQLANIWFSYQCHFSGLSRWKWKCLHSVCHIPYTENGQIQLCWKVSGFVSSQLTYMYISQQLWEQPSPLALISRPNREWIMFITRSTAARWPENAFNVHSSTGSNNVNVFHLCSAHFPSLPIDNRQSTVDSWIVCKRCN